MYCRQTFQINAQICSQANRQTNAEPEKIMPPDYPIMVEVQETAHLYINFISPSNW